MHREWHLRVRAVDGARRREHQMLDAVMAAAFEHRQRALHVAVEVRERRLDAVAHAGLRAEVDDAREFLGGEQLRHSLAVGEIELHELEIALALQHLEPRMLQRDVVVLVEIVEAHDLVAALEQELRGVKTDESSGSGDEYFQNELLPRGNQRRPSEASLGSTCLMSKMTVLPLPKLRMPSAPSSTNCLCATATTMPS